MPVLHIIVEKGEKKIASSKFYIYSVADRKWSGEGAELSLSLPLTKISNNVKTHII